MEVEDFAFVLGLEYNEAALKDLFNVGLDDLLPQWEMEGLRFLDFWGFIRFLRLHSQCVTPDHSEPAPEEAFQESALEAAVPESLHRLAANPEFHQKMAAMLESTAIMDVMPLSLAITDATPVFPVIVNHSCSWYLKGLSTGYHRDWSIP